MKRFAFTLFAYLSIGSIKGSTNLIDRYLGIHNAKERKHNQIFIGDSADGGSGDGEMNTYCENEADH